MPVCILDPPLVLVRILGLALAVPVYILALALLRILGLALAVPVYILGLVPRLPAVDTAMDNADTPTTCLKKSILRIASAMNSRTSQPFILV